MIRVVVGARSGAARADLEDLIRSSPALELAPSIDWPRISTPETSADVLLIEVDDLSPDTLADLADLPLPAVLLVDGVQPGMIAEALRLGIAGVLSREASLEEIEGALHAAAAGLVVTAPAFVGALVPNPQSVDGDLAEPLSARELEVLRWIAEGLSNKLIAHQLNISEHTVKTHVASIFGKLSAASRTEAVSTAVRRGLVML